MEKACSKCGVVQPIWSFNKNSHSRDGLHHLCKDCNKRYLKSRWNSGHRRDMEYRRRYGISLGQYDQMLDSQGGRCAICQKAPGKRRLAVDHCHTTGRIRSLLCSNCNIGIGKLNDDPNLVLSAFHYLMTHLARIGGIDTSCVQKKGAE